MSGCAVAQYSVFIVHNVSQKVQCILVRQRAVKNKYLKEK
jgi:hypothetical protein